jgi:predicted PurR-regulated permease PerM
MKPEYKEAKRGWEALIYMLLFTSFRIKASPYMSMLSIDPANRSHIYQLIAGISAVTLILTGCLIILSPFFPAILLATILALSTWPAFMWLNKKLGHRTRLAALLMTVALAFCFIVPLTIIGTSSAENFGKISDLATGALQGDTASVGAQLERIPYAGDLLAGQWRRMTADKETFFKLIEEYAGMTNEGLVKLGASIARGLLDLTLGVLIAYFFFRHGTRAAVRISNLIDRFGGTYGQHLLDVSKNTLIGVVYGMLGTALAQGALAAFGFWLVDVPGASFLGLMTFFLSFTPIGPPLIWVPATFWLYSEGHLYSAVFMGLWGLLAVSTIDNVLRPYFISLRGNLPFLLVLLGVAGGVMAFGFIGIFIGPTLLALAYALLTDWSRTREEAERARKGKTTA